MPSKELFTISAFALTSLFVIIFLALALMFNKENEQPAVRKSFSIAFLIALTGSTIYLLNLELIFYSFLVLGLIFLIVLLIPYRIDDNLTDDIPIKRVDERDIMFSRKELVPGTDKYEAYYKRRPEYEDLDNSWRKEPGLLQLGSIHYHPKAFKAAKDYFTEVDKLHEFVLGESDGEKISTDPEQITREVKKFALELGALDVGITRTQEYHFYAIKGRGKEYGNKIEIKHNYAIAFTVEMSHEMVMAAPKASIVMESAKQYLSAGTIVTEIAKKIRGMGFDARAHIDGNYQLICPLVARDAGLGEIGRMGLLMTPNHGPRVRIGVVTTDLKLQRDAYVKDHSVIDFCRMCKKCADCCPSNSISYEDPEEVDGVRRWKIDSASCFTFWCKAGTDCGRCMAVCPYSHPNHSFHKVVRWGIRHSKPFRYLALKLDDFFYGRKPHPKPLPQWIDNL